MKDHNNNEASLIISYAQLIKDNLVGDEAWIKVDGIPEIASGEFPDDMPLPRTTYLGPFAVYEY